MQFDMIYTDEQGETHFGKQEVPEAYRTFGPPPNPSGLLADLGTASGVFVFSVPAGTDVPAHPAPHPYICIVLEGTVEIVTSDGECRRFGPGRLLLCNDLTGKGHVTRTITPVSGAFINRLSA